MQRFWRINQIYSSLKLWLIFFFKRKRYTGESPFSKVKDVGNFQAPRPKGVYKYYAILGWSLRPLCSPCCHSLFFCRGFQGKEIQMPWSGMLCNYSNLIWIIRGLQSWDKSSSQLRDHFRLSAWRSKCKSFGKKRWKKKVFSYLHINANNTLRRIERMDNYYMQITAVSSAFKKQCGGWFNWTDLENYLP